MKIQTSLLILRPALVYGKEDLSYSYGPTGFIYKAINFEELVLWGDGSELREFIYVEDVAKIVDQLIQKFDSSSGFIFLSLTFIFFDFVISITVCLVIPFKNESGIGV